MTMRTLLYDNGLDAITAMDNWDLARNELNAMTRDLLRQCRRGIHSLIDVECHDGEGPGSTGHSGSGCGPHGEDPLGHLRAGHAEMVRTVEKVPDRWLNPSLDQVDQELVELLMLRHLTLVLSGERAPFPGYQELGVSPRAYLLGLADSGGEARRWILSRLLKVKDAGLDPDGKERLLSESRTILEYMEATLALLSEGEYPGGLIPLKPKRDMVRAVLEKTMGDLVATRNG